MKTLLIIIASIAALLMLFQLICGLWIKSRGADEAGKRYHIKQGIFTIVSGLLTSVLAIIVAAG